MHSYDLILTLTGGLVAALAGGYLTHRLKLSPIVGYLLAGVLVGPHTPGFVANHALAEQLAEVGVILLMFGVGLQFHFHQLLVVRWVATVGALGQSAVSTALGAAIGVAAGWSIQEAIVFGIALSVASTVVLARMLSDSGQLHTPAGHIAVGWLVVEDLLTVVALVLMPVLLGSSQESSSGMAVAIALLKVAALVAVTAWVGRRGIPWLLSHVARTQSRELFTLAVLAAALGVAVASASWFGVSMALGAFLAGLVVGQSDFSLRAAADALPMRDAFAVLFFVSVGMLLNPADLVTNPTLLAGTMAIIVLGKPVAAFAIVKMFGRPTRSALVVAAALGQIGEFSFIVVTLGAQLGVVSDTGRNVVVGAAILSITLNPFLFRTLPALDRMLRRRPGRQDPAPPDRAAEGGRAVLVGHGPVGQIVSRLLRENQIGFTVIEMNLDTVRALKAAGVDAVYGDASHEDTLRAAGVAEADSVIISNAGLTGAEEVVRLVRQINPRIQVLARTHYLREGAALRARGADEVFSGEGEVALAFTAAILSRLGATPEQIDRERARVHAELV